MEWSKQTYNSQYEKWVPWLEDLYLRLFTKDNKASYSTKENLGKAKVTGVSQVDNIQDGVNNMVGNELGQEGIGRPIGDLMSKEGANRFERQGKDDNGSYVTDSTGVTRQVAQGGQAVASAAKSGAEGVGNTVGGLFGGGKQ